MKYLVSYVNDETFSHQRSVIETEEVPVKLVINMKTSNFESYVYCKKYMELEAISIVCGNFSARAQTPYFRILVFESYSSLKFSQMIRVIFIPGIELSEDIMLQKVLLHMLQFF